MIETHFKLSFVSAREVDITVGNRSICGVTPEPNYKFAACVAEGPPSDKECNFESIANRQVSLVGESEVRCSGEGIEVYKCDKR